MKKRILSLIMMGMLVVPMVGCNASVKLFGKEIFSSTDTAVEEKYAPSESTPKEQPTVVEYTDEDILEMLVTGEYTLTINEESFVYKTEDMLLALYDGEIQYYVEHYQNAQYLIQIIDKNNENFVTFIVHTDTLAIDIVELNHNGQYLEGQDASQALSEVVYSELFNPEDGTLTKKQQTTKEEQKENTSKEEPKKEEPKKEQPKEEKKQEAPKTCKWCYTNQLPSGSGENDKCQECQEENWNFYCGDCGKSMSLEEYWSYGHDTGFCPSCYDKYIQATTPQEDTSDDYKHYYCDRCGKDCTFTNFLQEFEGWGIICEGCLLDLGY